MGAEPGAEPGRVEAVVTSFITLALAPAVVFCQSVTILESADAFFAVKLMSLAASDLTALRTCEMANVKGE